MRFRLKKSGLWVKMGYFRVFFRGKMGGSIAYLGKKYYLCGLKNKK